MSKSLADKRKKDLAKIAKLMRKHGWCKVVDTLAGSTQLLRE